VSEAVLGSKSFSIVPDVQGNPLLINAGNTPSIQSGTYATIPAAGTVGRLYVTSDTNLTYRDNGTSWVLINASSSSVVLQVIPSSVPATSGTSTITLANTTPTTANGTQVWSQTITPLASTSHINIAGSFTADHGTTNREVIALFFRGTTCIGVTGAFVSTIARIYPITFNFNDMPGSTATQTYSIRVACNAAGTWYVNQTSTAYFNGMLAMNGITVTEYA
jgi:hypothetical protein